MHAVILAGGEEKQNSPLFALTQGKNKSFLDVAGKPMIQWTIDAVSAADRVDQLHIIGIDASSGVYADKPLSFLPDQGSMLANIIAGVEKVHQLDPSAGHVLLASGDIPALTPTIVDWRIQAGLEKDVDIDYAVVDRRVMEERFPGANRSYIRLNDCEVCGGDLNLVHVKVVKDRSLWERLVAARKNVLKQAALVGWDVLFLLLLRKLTLAEAERRVCRNLDITGHATLSPYAEVAMDIDKPHQLDILRRDLAARTTV